MKKMMTKASLLAIAFIVSIPLGLGAQDEGFYPYSYARLSYVNGTVYVQRTSDLGYEKGEINLALVQGDRLGTESGQAEIHFGRRNYLRVDDDTKIEFAVLPLEGDERIKLHLTEGRAYLRISQLTVDKGVEVHTPDASFYVLEEGLYRFDVRLDRETQASVREGSLEAAAEDGSVLVRENESVAAADGRLLGDPSYADLRQDGFDTWNASRDGQLAARNGRQYLPAELEEYEDELGQNGQWVYERDYGNVWVPNVTYADWRPYLYGRWVWYPVIGWNWVSSEPWGWSVYHYGRWHWRFGLGWYWIPRHHWGPAWVHWWWNNDHIGWCPLSWYNRPVLLVDNRFYDRHYDRWFPSHNRAMTVVRRDQLQARDLHRRQLGAADRGRIGQVDFRRDQPSLRPAVDNARPQALAAKRAFAERPGARSQVKSVAPSNSLSPSRMRPGAAGAEVRSRERNAAVAAPERGAVARPTVRGPDAGGRVIRSFPSQRSSAVRGQAVSPQDRRGADAAAVRRGAAETRNDTARVSRPGAKATFPSRASVARETPRTRNDTGGAASGVTRKSETIKSSPSTARTSSDAGRFQSRSLPSRSSVSAAPSRLSSPSSSGPARTSSSYARPGASSRSSSTPSRSSVSSPSRSSSPSYSRPGASRSISSSQPRSAYSSPSRSGGSSGRSISAPRSGSSSSRPSYSAPRSSSSSGRSIGASRSGGSSGRSSASARSGSSPSRSSGSSSRSGSSKKKAE